MKEVIYRELTPNDYPFIETLIEQSFGLHRYLPDAKALAHFKHTYLQGCLAEQTYCRVAEANGKVVGVIMGKANAFYHLTPHILPAVLAMWHTLCMKFYAKRGGYSANDYEHLHKVYRNFLEGRSDKYDGVLTLFAVNETYRGMGLGKGLLHGLEEYFKSRKVQRIYLFTDSTCNTGFYDSHGFFGIDEQLIQVTRDGQETPLNVLFYEKPYAKLDVLTMIATALNDNHITWAVGGSLLLYFKNKTDTFHDIDIMVLEEDVEKLKSLLLPLGTLAAPNPDAKYKTKHFLEFTIDDVDIDVMAGFVIVNDGKDWDCSLKPEHIIEHKKINGVDIPLHSLDEWRKYYSLMGRTAKVEMIDQKSRGK